LSVGTKQEIRELGEVWVYEQEEELDLRVEMNVCVRLFNGAAKYFVVSGLDWLVGGESVRLNGYRLGRRSGLFDGSWTCSEDENPRMKRERY
jgi:hypothetical protein